MDTTVTAGAERIGGRSWELACRLPSVAGGPTDPSEVPVELSPVAVRVLGSLVEKSLTTPNQYPLSVAALLSACNQRSARDPVMELDEGDVQRGLRELRDHDLARTSPVRGRVPRHQHELRRQLGLEVPTQTVLGVLLLRGPQTVGEIRTRTERWHSFEDLEEVEAVLRDLAEHPFLPFVRELPREPGRRENRWTHLLGTATPASDLVGEPADTPAVGTAAPVPAPSPTTRLEELEARVGVLEGQLADLLGHLAPLLGDDAPGADE
jgi:uncharacterized protein YceH (UPF0502 family)